MGSCPRALPHDLENGALLSALLCGFLWALLVQPQLSPWNTGSSTHSQHLLGGLWLLGHTSGDVTKRQKPSEAAGGVWAGPYGHIASFSHSSLNLLRAVASAIAGGGQVIEWTICKTEHLHTFRTKCKIDISIFLLMEDWCLSYCGHDSTWKTLGLHYQISN